jgi:predicted nucleic acid-binding protein
MTRPDWAYVDTSVLVKRYVREPDSREASRITASYAVVTSALASVELLSALYAKWRGGSLKERALKRAVELYEQERAKLTIVELTAPIVGRAEDVIRRVPARTADALHLASALFFGEAVGGSVPFSTADARQRRSAESLGMNVIWVGSAVSR